MYACFWKIIKQYKPFLDKIDLTYTRYITMLVMWEKKMVNVKSLGEALCEAHERNLVVTITEKGEQLRESAASIPGAMAQCSDLEPEEAVTLYRILYKMLVNA